MNAQKRTVEILKRRLQSGEWPEGKQLPSLADLAKICGVCRTTMWRAVAQLQKETLLHAQERGAIIAGPPNTPLFQAIPESHAWQRVKTLIGREIMSGLWTDAMLLPINKMALRYGVAVVTVRKALLQLVREGILMRTGRRFTLVKRNASSHPSTVAFISQGTRERGILIIERRSEAIVDSFERECMRLGYEPRCEGFDPFNASGLIEFTPVIKGISGLSGCIVSLWKNGNDASWQRWLDLLNFLAGRKIPVIAVDQEGNIAFPDSLLRFANFRVLRIGSIRAGEMVAAALLRRKHTRIFYVAPFFKHNWAQDRFAGIRRYCASYGGPAVTVELCALEELGDHQDLAVGLLGLDKKELRVLYRGRYSSEELEEVSARLDRIKKTEILGKMAQTPIAELIRDFTGFLKLMAGKDHDQNAYDTLFGALGHISSNTALRSFLKPFFQNILDKGSPAVWACSDDTDAALALSFLRQSGVRVPDDISLCSFDNSRESFIYQMSSYDFNMHAMAQQALQMIIDTKHLKSRPVISEVDGFFVERRTTRK